MTEALVEPHTFLYLNFNTLYEIYNTLYFKSFM